MLISSILAEVWRAIAAMREEVARQGHGKRLHPSSGTGSQRLAFRPSSEISEAPSVAGPCPYFAITAHAAQGLCVKEPLLTSRFDLETVSP